jgi:predicted transcriptional regulator
MKEQRLYKKKHVILIIRFRITAYRPVHTLERHQKQQQQQQLPTLLTKIIMEIK